MAARKAAGGAKTSTQRKAKTRKAPARKGSAKKAAPRGAKPPAELGELAAKARVLGVVGAFGDRVVLEIPTPVALKLFGDDLAKHPRTDVIDGVERDLAALKKRAPELATSAIAATALAMAYEIASPYNSATSKSMCAKALREAMELLREQSPPAKAKDRVDEVGELRAARRARSAGAKVQPRS